VDADSEIEKAANQTISDIFASYGEDHFREGERRVLARLLSDGPKVLATGGGAFMSEDTRNACAANGVTIWLKADAAVLFERVKKKSNRPLLHQDDPEGVLRRLIAEREPFYAEADLTILSRDGPHQALVAEVLEKLECYLSQEQRL
jgi:shikimate kinase